MSNGNIFLSYRREGAAGHAGRLYDHLNSRFPGRVFMDVTGINLGEDFVVEIERHVGNCEVFIELIGEEWATSTDHDGKRRLDDPDDFVRMEVAAALRREVTIIPILLNGATMPHASTLPPDIAPLVRRQGLAITDTDFDHDVKRLITRLETVFAGNRLDPSFWRWLRFSDGSRARRAPLIGLGVFGLLLIGFIGSVLLPKLPWRVDNTNNFNAPSPLPKPSAAPTNYIPPGHTAFFVNSREGLNGKLAEHYVDFSFYYPKSWVPDFAAGKPLATNFAKVERVLRDDLTQENFAVGWYSSTGSPESEFPQLVEHLSSQFEKTFPEYRKVSEGPTKVNSLDGYEFRFESMSRNTAHGDIQIWGRAIFLRPPGGGENGVTLMMLATSLAPEIRSENDVGIKGETPLILRSFRFGPPR